METILGVDVVLDIVFNYLSNTELLRMREVCKQFQPRVLRLFRRRNYRLHLQTPSLNYPKGYTAFSYFSATMNHDLELNYYPLRYHNICLEFDPLSLSSLLSMLENYGENIQSLELRPLGFSGIHSRNKLLFGGLETYVQQFFGIFKFLPNVVSLFLHMDDHWLFKIPRLESNLLYPYIQFNLPKLMELSVYKNIPNHLAESQMPSLHTLTLNLEIENNKDVPKLAAAFKFFANWNTKIIVNIDVIHLDDDPLQTLHGIRKLLCDMPMNIKKIGLGFHNGFAGHHTDIYERMASAYQNIIYEKRDIIYALVLNIPENFPQNLQIQLPNLPSIEKLDIPVSVEYTSGITQQLFDTVKSLHFTNVRVGTSYPNIQNLICSFEVDVLPLQHLFPKITDLWIKNCNTLQFECILHGCPNLIKLKISSQHQNNFSRLDEWQIKISGFDHPDTILSQLNTLEEMENLARQQAYDRIIEIRRPSLVCLTKLKKLDVGLYLTDATIQLTLLEMEDFDSVAFIPYEVTQNTFCRLKEKCTDLFSN